MNDHIVEVLNSSEATKAGTDIDIQQDTRLDFSQMRDCHEHSFLESQRSKRPDKIRWMLKIRVT